ncbi:unnamed protein product, partial [Symbiodinium microadriaticum]
MGLLAVASHRAGSCLLPHFNQHVNLNKKIVIVVPEEPVNLEIVVLVSLVKTVHGLVTWIWLVTGQLPKGMRPVPHTFETYLLDEAACQNGISMSIQEIIKKTPEQLLNDAIDQRLKDMKVGPRNAHGADGINKTGLAVAAMGSGVDEDVARSFVSESKVRDVAILHQRELAKIGMLIQDFFADLRARSFKEDSSVVVDKLKSLVIPASAHFIRIDVKDFFMSGRHSEFVESCSRYVEEAWVTAFREVLKFILASQFVASEFCPGCVYKVTSGAGMGLACSGEVCDITFYDTVESKVLSDLTSFDVHCYMRFKDDILVVLSCDRAQRLALINHRKCFSRVWSLKVECISDTECQFLDLHISKGNQWRST